MDLGIMDYSFFHDIKYFFCSVIETLKDIFYQTIYQHFHNESINFKKLHHEKDPPITLISLYVPHQF